MSQPDLYLLESEQVQAYVMTIGLKEQKRLPKHMIVVIEISGL